MKSPFKIDNSAYTLYKAFPDTNVEHVINDSRTYNDGTDYFDGSDCTTATVFLVPKGHVALFVQELESFIQVLSKSEMHERFDDGDLIDLTEYLNFAVLHKKIKGGNFDFFVTNFMFGWSPYVNPLLEGLSESTGKKLQTLSSFTISAGSAHGDASVSEYAYSYLTSKILVKPSFAGCAQIKDDFSYEEIVPVFNEPAEVILNTFIKIYFKHIPQPIGEVSDYRKCLNKGIKRLSA